MKRIALLRNCASGLESPCLCVCMKVYGTTLPQKGHFSFHVFDGQLVVFLCFTGENPSYIKFYWDASFV